MNSEQVTKCLVYAPSVFDRATDAVTGPPPDTSNVIVFDAPADAFCSVPQGLDQSCSIENDRLDFLLKSCSKKILRFTGNDVDANKKYPY